MIHIYTLIYFVNDPNTCASSKDMKNTSTIALAILISLFAAELLLRIEGYQPYQRADIVPLTHCSQLATPHQRLGFIYNPGHHVCQLNGLPFSATIGPDSFRVASYLAPVHRPHIGLYGCSVTWGQGLDDTATMAWKLQQLMPDASIHNYGIGAGSNVQSLVLLQQQIQSGRPPGIVVVNYASFQNMRNAMTRAWRTVWRQMLTGSTPHKGNGKIPFARLSNRSLDIHYYTYSDIYHTQYIGSSHSALINLINNAFESAKDRSIDDEAVSLAVLKKMNEMCENHHIRLIIIGLYTDKQTQKVINACHRQGMEAYQFSTDLRQSEYTLCPIDNHPNGKANTLLAQHIYHILSPKSLRVP